MYIKKINLFNFQTVVKFIFIFYYNHLTWSTRSQMEKFLPFAVRKNMFLSIFRLCNVQVLKPEISLHILFPDAQYLFCCPFVITIPLGHNEEKPKFVPHKFFLPLITLTGIEMLRQFLCIQQQPKKTLIWSCRSSFCFIYRQMLQLKTDKFAKQTKQK